MADPTTAAVHSALATLAAERRGLDALSDALAGPLGAAFAAAVGLMAAVRGRVIVTGVGKSGHMGRKIAATLASTGTPAAFVHAAEASHGDLGMITAEDAILALSWSGETAELSSIVAYAARFAVPLIALTASAESTLARAARVALVLPRAEEACPNGLAPTTSSTMQVVLGDALAVALLEARGFSAGDFGVFHPGGKLGAALRQVREVMHTGAELPVVGHDTSMKDAIYEMTAKRFGCVLVTAADGRLGGILTDGDLRRAIERHALDGALSAVMTRDPVTIGPGALAAEAVKVMEARRITVLPVTDAGRAVGLLHMHDLLRLGVR